MDTVLAGTPEEPLPAKALIKGDASKTNVAEETTEAPAPTSQAPAPTSQAPAPTSQAPAPTSAAPTTTATEEVDPCVVDPSLPQCTDEAVEPPGVGIPGPGFTPPNR
jgi:hypothetical protein